VWCRDSCAALELQVSISQSTAQLGTSETSGVGFLTDVFSCELSAGGSPCVQLAIKFNPHPLQALGTAGDNLKPSPSAGI